MTRDTLPPTGRSDAVPAAASQLASLYERWRKPLLRLFLRRMGNSAQAEDAAQEVFARMAAARTSLAPQDEAPYLHTAARNISHDAWRQAARRADIEAVSLDERPSIADEIPADDTTDPACRIEHRQRLSRLEQALAELPERRREAFVLHAIDGLTQTEVAQRMGISRRMVHNHVTLAYAYCQMRVQYRSQEAMKIAQALQAGETP